jgi:hypothetical protein
MRVPRLALPAALAAATVALTTFASPAFADDAAGATVYPVSGEVVFASSSLGSVALDYLCTVTGTEDAQTLAVVLSQPGGDGTQLSSAGGSAAATCDGTVYSAHVELALIEGSEIAAGTASLDATLAGSTSTQQVTVTRSDIEPVPTPTATPTPTPTPTPPR